TAMPSSQDSLRAPSRQSLLTQPETIQWYGVKYADTTPPTFAFLDIFRAVHLNGKVTEALMANSPKLLSWGPQI
ncbi:hypothetical protein B0H15DRAFT_739418, partial [Mycena belliarum]